MRTVIGYDPEGHKLWSDNVPASPALSGAIRGTLVVGENASREAQSERKQQWARDHRVRVKEGLRVMVGCHLDGHCLHHVCMAKRRDAARQMYETGLNATQIGQRLDRARSTVNDLIHGRWERKAERCGDGCARPIGHEGACRGSWHSLERCDAWMPNAKQGCGRRKGHGNDHRTAEAMAARADHDAAARNAA